MQERLSASLARQRFSTAMLGAFAGFALLLASLGVYSVMSYLVSQSTRDIGVRVALGAQPGNILRLVMSQGIALVGIGIVGGVAGAIALTRVMASLLFGVTATDPLTFGSVCLILGIVAFAAILIPAFRATSVDPMVALREE
jgi:ABC-type antimicrobial peptide transport system permease subunit